MKEINWISLCLLTLLLVACAGSSETVPEPEKYDGPVAEKDVHNPCGRPMSRAEGLDLDVVGRLGYVRGFERNWKIPAWVGYRLDSRYYQPGAPKFDWVGRFLVDPDLHGDARITHNHYTDTGLERAQMASASAMQGRTEDVVRESYYLSNVAPQYASLELRLWMNLEGQVRKWARKYGRVYVIAGPVFAEPGLDGRLAKAEVKDWMTPAKPGIDVKVAIPTHFFKIVYRKTGDQMFAQAFVVPNQKERFENDWDFARWQVSIDEVESLTGLDFLSRLSDDWERPLESKKEAAWE